MNDYVMTLWSLALALLAQSLVTGLSVERYLRKDLASSQRRSWLAVALGSLLLALHHAYTLELALRTGLFDIRQAILAGLVAIFLTLGVYGLGRNTNA